MTHLTWPASGIVTAIASNEVHLWAWSLEPAGLASHVALLDQVELGRFHSFRFAADRGRYAVAHANMRRILSGYVDRSPAEICFRVNRFGKPELLREAPEDPLSSIQFSLSHSRHIAVVAVALGHPVGVDVEEIRPIEPEVADAHFSASELADLRGLHGDAWLSGFYRCWTRKEAILKGEGVGLQRALDSFDVSLREDAPPELLGAREPFRYAWRLHHLTPAEGTVAAVATADTNVMLACFSFLP